MTADTYTLYHAYKPFFHDGDYRIIKLLTFFYKKQVNQLIRVKLVVVVFCFFSIQY